VEIGGADRDAVCGVDSYPKEPCLCWGLRTPHRKGHYWGNILTWLVGVVASVVLCMNEVNLFLAWLVPGWVTIFVRAYHLGM